MDTEAAKKQVASMWEPMATPEDTGVLGKNLEEIFETIEILSRVGNVIARSLIQGIDERDPADPINGVTNRAKLEAEMGDVIGKFMKLIEQYGLDADVILDRAHVKYAFSKPWFDFLRLRS
jgi:hypothetical protein